MLAIKHDAKFAHRLFQFGILLKGLDGLLELAGGAALLLTTQPAIRQAIAMLTKGELAEDPGDYVANLATRTAQHLSPGTQHFAAAYLFLHGLIKIALVAGLLRGWRGSYPLALLVLTAFIGYQLYRLSNTPSLLLSVLTVIDVAVVILIAREWSQVRSRRGNA